jgi:hypothetical protein
VEESHGVIQGMAGFNTIAFVSLLRPEEAVRKWDEKNNDFIVVDLVPRCLLLFWCSDLDSGAAEI